MVAAPGVLGNDTDADSDPLTAVLDTDVSHGTLSLAADGGFTYTPTSGYSGPDSFTYHADDGTDARTSSPSRCRSSLRTRGSSWAPVVRMWRLVIRRSWICRRSRSRRGSSGRVPGMSNSTGNLGVPALLPLLTHGAPETENSNVDANWILGISTSGDGDDECAGG